MALYCYFKGICNQSLPLVTPPPQHWEFTSVILLSATGTSGIVGKNQHKDITLTRQGKKKAICLTLRPKKIGFYILYSNSGLPAILVLLPCLNSESTIQVTIVDTEQPREWSFINKGAEVIAMTTNNYRILPGANMPSIGF